MGEQSCVWTVSFEDFFLLVLVFGWWGVFFHYFGFGGMGEEVKTDEAERNLLDISLVCCHRKADV